MLRALTIQDVVLIQHLDIQFEDGLGVLTGETGAGKSILLDALGLALGERGDSRLVRKGQPQAVVTACFEVENTHPSLKLLQEHGIENHDTILLRRILSAEGRSRAFINDQPVSIGLMHLIGEQLIEIHGQFDRLLEPRFHRDFLDAYAENLDLRLPVEQSFYQWQEKQKAFEIATKAAQDKSLNEAFLRHTLDELKDHAPIEGEEEQLQLKRSQISNAAKIADITADLSALLDGERGTIHQISKALRLMEKAVAISSETFGPLSASLENSYSELQEVSALSESILQQCSEGPAQLDLIEKRLGKIRALTRKHHCSADDLPALLQKLAEDIDLIENTETKLFELEKAANAAKQTYIQNSQTLSISRQKSSEALDKAIVEEFLPLKLTQAQFKTQVSTHPESLWGPAGIDQIKFLVATNKGTEFGDLKTIASGGERSRFMLALKVILAKTSSIPTIIFDEIDSGIGGATARAIGERLSLLGQNVQALVITHSPQVASLATHHWRVEKASSQDSTTSTVVKLDSSQRREEIARMLAGEDVTDEARAAADKLMMTA